jgi:hypothetical protein
MQSPFSFVKVMSFLLINILVSALTTWVVVRTLVPPLAQAAPPAAAPTAIATDTPDNNAATPDAPAIPQAGTPVPAAAQATPTLLSAGTTTTVNVRISSVIYAGQLSREVVVIVNEGDKVDMTGWTLVPSRGAPYAFKQVIMFKNSFVNLHTTTGTDVPNDLYWGLGEPMWQSGDELKLLRTDGSTAATFKVK